MREARRWEPWVKVVTEPVAKGMNVERFIMSSHTVNGSTFRELVEATAGAGVPAIALTYQNPCRPGRCRLAIERAVDTTRLLMTGPSS